MRFNHSLSVLRSWVPDASLAHDKEASHSGPSDNFVESLRYSFILERDRRRLFSVEEALLSESRFPLWASRLLSHWLGDFRRTKFAGSRDWVHTLAVEVTELRTAANDEDGENSSWTNKGKDYES